MMPVLVPLKPLAQAKSRLASELAPPRRQRLARAMADDLLAMLGAQPGIGPIVVCGSDESARHVARRAGVRFLPESHLGAHGLNAVVDAAAGLFAEEGHDALLVVPADLPLLTGGELQEFLRVHSKGGLRAVTIGPDRWYRGTNLLAWRGLPNFPAQYGPGSFARHCAAARSQGARLTLCELPGASVDVDEPADLAVVREAIRVGLAPCTHAVLREIVAAARSRGLENI